MSDEKRAKDEEKTALTDGEATPTAVDPGPTDTKKGKRSYMGSTPGGPAEPREGGRSYEA